MHNGFTVLYFALDKIMQLFSAYVITRFQMDKVICEWFLCARHGCLTYWSDLIRETDVADEESWSGLAWAVPAWDTHWRIRYFSMLLSSPLPRVTESVFHGHCASSPLPPDFNQQTHFKNRPFLMCGGTEMNWKSFPTPKPRMEVLCMSFSVSLWYFCRPLRMNRCFFGVWNNGQLLCLSGKQDSLSAAVQKGKQEHQ